MQKRYDILGQKFNKLTVVAFSHKSEHRINFWECVCECGGKTVTNVSSLKSGHTKSCGCAQKNVASKLRPVIHGDSAGGKVTAEFKAWSNMKSRCYDAKDASYPDYGGRGIRVCSRWMDEKYGYINFLSDMGRKPTGKHSLDRFPNVNGNYEPLNCRWATAPQQNRNKRSNVLVEYDGSVMVMKDFASKNNIKYKHLHRSIKKGYYTFGFTFTEIEKNHYKCHRLQ